MLAIASGSPVTIANQALTVLIRIFAPAALIFLAGCGGNGNGSTRTSQIASGVVILPTGFNLPMSRLAVATEAGQVSVGKTGSFSAPVSSAGPRLAQLIDTTTDKIVLLGYVDSSPSGSMFAGGKSQISPLTTASALLFLGLSGPNMPAATWESFLETIMGSSQAASLAKTVANSVNANPTAITDGDSAIEAGIAAVQATATPPSSLAAVQPEVHGLPQKASVVQFTQTQTTSGNLINVTPAGQQSGIVIEPNPTGDGIVVVNNLRRRAGLFAYEVAKGQTASTVVPLAEPVPFISDQEIEPEEALDGVYTALYNALQGKLPYYPVTSGPYMLASDKASPVTVYDLVVVGTGSIDSTPDIAALVAPDNSPTQDELASEWAQTSLKLGIETVAKDVIEPIFIYMMLDVKSATGAPGSPEFEQNIENVVASLKDVSAAILAHDFKLAAETFFNDIIKTPNLKDVLLNAAGNWAVSAGVSSAEATEKLLSRLESADTAMVAINTCFLTVDLSRVFTDSTLHDVADRWVATVLLPKITLSPNPAIVNDVQNIAVLKTLVQNETDLSNFRFQWSSTTTEGSLEEPFTSTAMPSGPTTFSDADYVANIPKLHNGGTDTVTVTVYSASDLEHPIGTASALVKAQPGTESGTISIDSTDDYTGLIANDPWVISIVATCPYVAGATSYLVEASGPNTGQYTYYVSTANGVLQVLDANKKPYPHYLANGQGVKIAVFGLDAYNASQVTYSQAVKDIEGEYPLTTVLITYQ